MNKTKFEYSPSLMLALAVVFVMVIPVLSGCAAKNDFPYDDNVYSTKYFAGDSVYFSFYTDQLGCAYMDDPGKAYYACIDPLCLHDGVKCPAYSFPYAETLVVRPEERDDPFVFIFGRHGAYDYVDGKLDRVDSYTADCAKISVFDAANGQNRVIAEEDFSRVNEAWYLNGKIYMSVWYLYPAGGASNRIGALDVRTGEYSEIDADEEATAIGISEGRLYYITASGSVYSCDSSLSDIRDEYECGISSMRSDNVTLTAYADSGMLYYEKNCHVADEYMGKEGAWNYMISDVYAVRLNDKDAGEALVAEGVYRFHVCNGDLYYNVWDYEEHGTVSMSGIETTVRSYDGGTLMHYDSENGASEECFSDCGISFFKIYDVTDEYVIFWGVQYRDPETCVNFDMNLYMCVCNIRTGEWFVLYHSTLPKDVENTFMSF